MPVSAITGALMLGQRREGVPTIIQHWVNVSCLLQIWEIFGCTVAGLGHLVNDWANMLQLKH